MIQCKVNGVERAFNGDPEMPLLWYLRDLLQLTGTKYGCGMGLCGACTVHVNGAATRSCVTFMRSAAGKDIVTIEGLSAHGDHPVQQAWKACRVPQCGYYQSGQIMQAVALLREKPKPTELLSRWLSETMSYMCIPGCCVNGTRPGEHRCCRSG
jgi:isoquinoline 1-oxidoreductase alpha subunit